MFKKTWIAAHFFTLCAATLTSLWAMPSLAADPLKLSVRVAYLIPADRKQNDKYIEGIEDAMLSIRRWYKHQLGGKTFRLNDPIVETYRTDHVASWYETNKPKETTDKGLFTWWNGYNDAIPLLGRLAENPNYIWIIYLDAPGGTGAGSPGFAILVQHDIRGLVGKAPNGASIPTVTGGSAHEIGHALGLDHEGPEDSVMQFGYGKYPNTFLSTQQKRQLLANKFISGD